MVTLLLDFKKNFKKFLSVEKTYLSILKSMRGMPRFTCSAAPGLFEHRIAYPIAALDS